MIWTQLIGLVILAAIVGGLYVAASYAIGWRVTLLLTVSSVTVSTLIVVGSLLATGEIG